MMDIIETNEKPFPEKSGIISEAIYSNTLCRIILMFIHRNKTSLVLKKSGFTNKSTKKMSYEVAAFSLVT
jgi:hypothetical protein